ncbi:MAG TPA: hypothetical protein VGH13_04325 [Xanthobacteraceae bacterium]|jgi:hypothetical protein
MPAVDVVPVGDDARSREKVMANTAELVEAICTLIRTSPVPIPIMFMNHGVETTAAIIGAVVERCARANIALTAIFIDPELGGELGLDDGRVLDHGGRPTIRWELGLGREVRFERD